MPAYAKPENQAARAVRHALALGTPRHGSHGDGRIHSVGTARDYQQALTLAARWDMAQHGSGIRTWDTQRAMDYLRERATEVSQKTLDLDRQALQILPGVGHLDRVQSLVTTRGLAQQGRAYTPDQVRLIAAAQTPQNALATEIAYAAGLRAHELYTLRPAAVQPPSAHRDWSPDRFQGRDGVRYTVIGKGGLTREVLLPQHLADRLEARRLEEPRQVTDRGIHYVQHYALGGGAAWSRSVTAASQRVLGWSTGAHGLRHSYAQERLAELQARGLTYDTARATVAQELGHFREDVTTVYLR